MSYFTWDMGSEVLDDYVARGICTGCYVSLGHFDECPDCSELEDE